MDFERIIKRLGVILALSLLLVLGTKVLLGKAFNNLSKAAEKKQRSATARPPASQQAPVAPVAGPEAETPVTASMPDSAETVAENPATQ